MSIIKYDNNNVVINEKIFSNILIKNKEFLLVSILEIFCKIICDKKINNENQLFKQLCEYLYDIGILEDSISYSEQGEIIRKLYGEYLLKIMNNIKQSSENILTIKDNEEKQIQNTNLNMTDAMLNKIQIINSMYSSNFAEFEQIGEGGFGKVFKAYNKIDGQQYAIKKIIFPDINDSNNIRSFNEVKYLSQLNHKNIIRYHTTWLELDDIKTDKLQDEFSEEEFSEEEFSDKNFINKSLNEQTDIILPKIYPILYIQMELCSCSLRDYLRNRNYSGIISDMIFEKKCIRGIINGLLYIHNKGILHRDLNPNNIFLDNMMIPKIGDFGMAINNFKTNLQQTQSKFGVEIYRSPEFEKDGIYTEKSDVYSVGIIFFEILQYFSTDMERIKVIDNIKHNKYPSDFIEKYSEYQIIIKNMLKNMDERITTQNVFDMIKNI